MAACKIEQIHPWDTLACCWDVKQPINKQLHVCADFRRLNTKKTGDARIKESSNALIGAKFFSTLAMAMATTR